MCHHMSESVIKVRPSLKTSPTSAVPSMAGNENTHFSASAAHESDLCAPLPGPTTAGPKPRSGPASASTHTPLFDSLMPSPDHLTGARIPELRAVAFPFASRPLQTTPTRNTSRVEISVSLLQSAA